MRLPNLAVIGINGIGKGKGIVSGYRKRNWKKQLKNIRRSWILLKNSGKRSLKKQNKRQRSFLIKPTGE